MNHHSTSIVLLTAVIFTLGLMGCSRTTSINGEVFIKTKGGNTIPLSLVTVSFYDQKQTEIIMDLILEEMKNKGKPFEGFADSVFHKLPTPVLSVQSGSDGKFNVNLQNGKGYIVCARSTRQIGLESEKTYWMFRFAPPKQAGGSFKDGTLTLANNTMVGSDYPPSWGLLPYW